MTAEEHTKVWNAAVNNTLKCVLEIIDEISDDQVIQFGYMTYGDGKEELRNRVLALKGGEQG